MITALACALAMNAPHSFQLRGDDFLLDGKPFQILSGEMHPARIPVEYWRHRIRMAKAMGCNTIAAYIFWNYQEPQDGKFDFKSTNHDVAKFIKIAQEEGMWVLLRPGPYVCAEWDFGGIPPYLLRYPDLKVRCMDPRYMSAVERYLKRLAAEVRPLQVTHGGPILMVQIENEYGSYGNDRDYVKRLKQIWEGNGIDVPFYTADGATPYMLECGSLPGCAVGLDPGTSNDAYAVAQKANPGVPVFSSETYPGWLTHWGENWAKVDTDGISNEVKWLLDNKKSFNLYVVHGGTNFGWTAGANSGGKGYEPDVTSYDYDAPITEQGRATPKYMALRDLIAKETGITPPPIPDPIPATEVPEFKLEPFSSVWANLPAPKHYAQPKPFEEMGQDHGFALYRTRLIGHKSGRLTVTDLHDYATAFLDGKFVGALDRREGKNSIDLPQTGSKDPTLDLLVEGMGRINFAQQMIDRKGITDRVTLNGMTLMSWDVYNLPMDDVASLHPGDTSRQGIFLHGSFDLEKPADTFLDCSALKKGVVWVNGHNLGRYWEIGPQRRLYCPAPWLKSGRNEVVVFDLLATEPATMKGEATLEGP
ncbi:MAG TPA: beta-galactosidase family protein [Fimbriimonadaceae bacterium]|nr:beta-galactosidase family protein [Fimbriimonadaceae bacterium]